MGKTSKQPAAYVAFLRGINVGGNKKVPMAVLKQLLEDEGYANIKTILASGNVMFESKEGNEESLRKAIAVLLEKKFGFSVPVILVRMSQIEKMIEEAPFKKIKVNADTRLYVTFLSNAPTSKMPIPYTSPDKSFQILAVKDKAIFSVLDLKKTGTVDAMSFIEKEFGKDVTTRNWNTIEKLTKGKSE